MRRVRYATASSKVNSLSRQCSYCARRAARGEFGWQADREVIHERVELVED